MKRSNSQLFIRTAVLCMVGLLGMQAWAASGKSNPKPGKNGAGAFATGKYRNLFVEQGHSESEITAKIDTAFQKLFHGDAKTEALYFPVGKNANGPLAYLTDWNSGDVRTEGMSYGMMIAVQMNKKQEFDALWNWTKTYMYISDPKHPSYKYFSWSCKTDGTPNDETSAPDGEEYFVMSLYFAAGRWGNGKGIYNYKAEADQLLSAILHREVMTGPTKFGERTVGPQINAKEKMVRFVPVVNGDDFSDPSYHLPAFYELWARWGPKEDRQFWAEAADVSRSFFVKTADAKTGLTPAYANYDGTPHATRFPQSGVFGSDAWRTASNWSVDWSWWRKAPQEQELSDRIQAFFESQGMDTYGHHFTLDGKLISREHAAGLVSTNAVASLAATDPRAKKFVDALWNTPVPTGQYRYYDGVLYLMSMLHCSGRFRIWPPR